MTYARARHENSEQRIDSYRRKAMQTLGLDVRWLDSTRAANAFDHADQFCSATRHGLNTATVSAIDRLVIDGELIARAWLEDRFPADGSVQIVFSRTDVCVLEAAAFLERWRELFMPARDDAFVVHNHCRKVLVYCHEEELEVGERSF